MKKFSENTPPSLSHERHLPPRRDRRALSKRHAVPAHPADEVLRRLVGTFHHDPRTAARAERRASNYRSLRHRARGDVGRIMWLMNEAGRLEEVRNER